MLRQLFKSPCLKNLSAWYLPQLVWDNAGKVISKAKQNVTTKKQNKTLRSLSYQGIVGTQHPPKIRIPWSLQVSSELGFRAQAPAVQTGEVGIQHGMVRESQDKLHARFPSRPTALIPKLALLPTAKFQAENG